MHKWPDKRHDSDEYRTALKAKGITAYILSLRYMRGVFVCPTASLPEGGLAHP